MKLNWGHYIAIAFTLFASFIMYMVVSSFYVNIDLVTEDYYARELAFQDKMIQKANFEELGAEIKVTQYDNGVVLEYPNEIVDPIGEVLFYHHSREMFDKSFPIAMDEKRKQVISREDLVAGKYRVNLTWESEGKEYFQKVSLFVQ